MGGVGREMEEEAARYNTAASMWIDDITVISFSRVLILTTIPPPLCSLAQMPLPASISHSMPVSASVAPPAPLSMLVTSKPPCSFRPKRPKGNQICFGAVYLVLLEYLHS